MLSKRKRNSGTAGFSLVEALVALAIAALLAAVLTRFVSGTRANAQNVREEIALELASDDLLEHLAIGKSLPGRIDGRSGRLAWHVDIEPIAFSANAEVVSEKKLASASNAQPGAIASSPPAGGVQPNGGQSNAGPSPMASALLPLASLMASGAQANQSPNESHVTWIRTVSLPSLKRRPVGAMQSIRSGSSRNHRKHRPRKLNSADAGFSLIEVLATLLVTMLLMLSLTPFVSQMLATWARGADVASLVELKTRGLNQLRRDLRHAIVWTGYGQTQNLAAFVGNETSMSFPIIAGLGPAGLGVEYISFTVGTSTDGRALVRRRAPVIGSGVGSFSDPVVLLSGPYRYVFKYYTRDGEALTVWHKGRMDLPARIELAVADRNGRHLFELPIAIPTFASMSAGCIATKGMQGCPVKPATAQSLDQMLRDSGILQDGKS